jgi:hypothetical protein
MAVGSGLGSQLGIAEESTWGTAVAVTRFYPVDSVNVKLMKKPVQGQGLQAGTFVNQGSLRADTATWASGDAMVDFTSKQMGLLMKHALGSAAIVQNGATAAWTQTWTLGSTVTGKGLTVQYGAPQTNGTVVPYTIAGCKVSSWDLSCAQTDILKAKFSFVGQTVTTATSLASASYPTASNVFHFKQGSLTVAGSPYLGFRDFTLTGDNGLADDMFYLGNAGLIAEPVRKDFTKLNFKGTVDFVDTTLSAAYAADTELAIVLSFVGKQIVTGSPNYYETLTITLNGLRVNGDVPVVPGPDILSIPFDADILGPVGGGTALSISYTSLDVAV